MFNRKFLVKIGEIMVNRSKEFLEPLRTEDDIKEVWEIRVNPKPIDEYREALNIGKKDIRSEVGYNLQYLEFMDSLLDSFYLHNVVRQQTIKYFVINASSVIDAILFDYIKGKGWSENQQTWITDETFNSESKNQDGKEKEYLVIFNILKRHNIEFLLLI